MRALYRFSPVRSPYVWSAPGSLTAASLLRELGGTDLGNLGLCQVLRCSEDEVALVLERSSDEDALADIARALANLGLLAGDVFITRLLSRAIFVGATGTFTALGLGRLTRNPLLGVAAGALATWLADKLIGEIIVELETYRAQPRRDGRSWTVLPVDAPGRRWH